MLKPLPTSYIDENIMRSSQKCYEANNLFLWRKRSIPTHSEWLYPLTFDAGKGLKEA